MSYEEIEGNQFNLTVSSYVEAEDTREIIDIAELFKVFADSTRMKIIYALLEEELCSLPFV